MPSRVQRTRTKGGGMPAGAVYVGRPTKWGNKYEITENRDGTWDIIANENWGGKTQLPRSCRGLPRDVAARRAVTMFEVALRIGECRVTVEDVRRELRGKDLACWCPLGSACHADVLLEIAN